MTSNVYLFQIDEATGNLVILRRLSISEGYILNISVVDNGGLTAHTVIQANVEDVNDHAPVFAKENYEFRITEGIVFATYCIKLMKLHIHKRFKCIQELSI